MELYFRRHDGAAVTCDDFVAAIGDANGRQLAQFRRWYSQAGTPHVAASASYDADRRVYELTLTQATAPTPGQPSKEPFLIPFAVGLVDFDSDLPLQLEGEAHASGATRVLELTRETQRSVSSTCRERRYLLCCATSRRRSSSTTRTAMTSSPSCRRVTVTGSTAGRPCNGWRWRGCSI
jgi:aminopeptidase N